MQLPDLDSLRCFVEASKLLNFRAASKVVGLTPAALGQRIKKLEDEFGVELFTRTTRRVELTEAGLALLPVAEEAIDAARRCALAARGELGPAPVDLVVGTRHELGMSWLVPMLPALRDAHPHVTFHLYVGSGPDLEDRVRTRQLNCAVSSRRIHDPSVDFIRLHEEAYVLVASPELLERRPFDTPEDAANHVLIDTSAEVPLFRYWRDAPGGVDSLTFGELVRMGTIDAIRAMVVSGEGVAVLPDYLVQPDIHSGKLVALLPDVRPVSDHFRLLFREDDPLRVLYASLARVMMEHPLQ
ncbi:MAG: LysR family transcriptional regulator [Deltaproteobacteria bacterium]|nr:MAG: LysR family transcriptional regulator [Deltaproteobacteria bacterium]